MRALIASGFGLLAIAALPQGAGGAEFDDDVFENRKLQVRFTVPEGWTLTRQTGYPSLLAFVSRGGARISLSYTRLARQQKVIQVLADNNRALETLGLKTSDAKRVKRLGHKLWQTVAQSKDGSKRNHQVYLSAGQVIYILTLSCKAADERRGLADVDYIIESLKMKRWALPQEALVRERGRSRGKAQRPFGGKDLGGRDLGGRELGGRELGGRELGGREFGGKELGGKEKATPDQGPREVTDRARKRPASGPVSRPAAPQRPGGPSETSSRSRQKS
ncbi:MAG: hypothetical protein CSA65_03200 [Proteobacteria bacterium]|nr:MAG: hypothetical protein CSB49_03095 [Pseudomonadota bacterium]PIE19142.1 MAG: hypothetical protein CSA65_03200 [Pseudomonadota bacterium]